VTQFRTIYLYDARFLLCLTFRSYNWNLMLYLIEYRNLHVFIVSLKFINVSSFSKLIVLHLHVNLFGCYEIRSLTIEKNRHAGNTENMLEVITNARNARHLYAFEPTVIKQFPNFIIVCRGWLFSTSIAEMRPGHRQSSFHICRSFFAILRVIELCNFEPSK